jgi:uncharacterized protein (TIGR02145 family)
MLRLSLLFILAVSLFWGCTIGFFDESVIDKCGGEKYTSSDQICEDNVLKAPCGEVYYDIKIQFCFEQEIKVYDKCGGDNYNPHSIEQICENNILKTKCDILDTYYDKKTQFCHESGIFGKCDGKEYEPATQDCCDNTKYTFTKHKCVDGIVFNKCENEWYNSYFEYCAGNVVMNKEKFVDSRDGNAYKYVIIGSQTWMAENLRYETSNTKCYNNDPSNCEIFGILYDWNTAITICPSGWHLPSDEEWRELRRFIALGEILYSEEERARLKANSDLWISDKGTDDFGFTALPGGYYFNNFTKIGEWATFWSTTISEFHANTSHFRYISNSGGLDIAPYTIGKTWTNVRCIKD